MDDPGPLPTPRASSADPGHAHFQLVREREAAALLAIAPKTLRAWRVAGSGRGPPFIKLGGSGAVRYRLVDLQRFVEAGLRSSTSET